MSERRPRTDEFCNQLHTEQQWRNFASQLEGELIALHEKLINAHNEVERRVTEGIGDGLLALRNELNKERARHREELDTQTLDGFPARLLSERIRRLAETLDELADDLEEGR